MQTQLFLDLILTTATCFSLVGLLGIAASLLPWSEEELEQTEGEFGEILAPFSEVIPVKREARRAA